mmetsp:Transcript_47377/g.155189  ORF Transcript_47377/g.155189 Transcript_47377/m.155189 type:complete len:86 (-) Transcript_47377:366-623(-)
MPADLDSTIKKLSKEEKAAKKAAKAGKYGAQQVAQKKKLAKKSRQGRQGRRGSGRRRCSGAARGSRRHRQRFQSRYFRAAARSRG